MRYCEFIVEARTNPEKNIKVPTEQIFKKYLDINSNNNIYVHFNKIEKVGVNLNSNNTFGPVGVYAMPLRMAISFGLYHSKIERSKYANILKLNSTAKVLNLDTVDIPVMQSLVNLAVRFHKKKLKYKTEYYNSLQIPGTIKQCWDLIQSLLYDYCNRRGWRKKLMHMLNIFFRNAGYDTIIDSNNIINDNPRQIVFLTSQPFSIVETIPIRYQ